MVETLIEFDFEGVFMTSPPCLFHMKSSTKKQIQLYKSKYQTVDIGLVTVKEMCLLLRSKEVLKVGIGKHYR